jgi:hypothetical protein
MMASASGPLPQTAREVRGPAAVIPVTRESPAKIIVDPPVFGPGALDVSPRIGHLHLTVDDGPWHWADASGEPLIIQSLTPGPHRVQIELADPTHRVIDKAVVNLVIPDKK